MSGVVHAIVRQSMPTACCEALDLGLSRRSWPGGLLRREAAGRLQRGRGLGGRWKAPRPMQSASVAMSTLRRSDTGPSSSTFHRDDRAVVNVEYREFGASSE
eukprot:1918273-Pleurochrysis_carterae.AAC.3